jgi:hypothetical protein
MPGRKKREFETETGSCLITVGPQEGIGPVVYENAKTAPQTVTTKINAKNVVYTTSGFLGCGVPNGTYTNGEYVDSFSVKSFNQKGKQLNYSVIGE